MFKKKKFIFITWNMPENVVFFLIKVCFHFLKYAKIPCSICTIWYRISRTFQEVRIILFRKHITPQSPFPINLTVFSVALKSKNNSHKAVLKFFEIRKIWGIPPPPNEFQYFSQILTIKIQHSISLKIYILADFRNLFSDHKFLHPFIPFWNKKRSKFELVL